MKLLCRGVLGLLAVSLLVVGVALLGVGVLRETVDRQVKEKMILKNDSDIFKMWEEPPLPIYMQYYMFNVTNPLEVLDGEKPIVVEIGPYTYRELRPRENVHILDNGTRVSFLNPKTYIFVEEMSVGDPEVDLIRTVNVPAVVAMEIATESVLRLPMELLLMLYKEEMFALHTVDEWLWGYEDRFLKAISKVHPIDPKFGFFSKLNATDDGEYVVLSGKENYKDFTRIVGWRGREKLSWWTSPTSNMINGTDGSTFHPFISSEETIYVFSSDMCRSIYLTYQSYVNVKGIPAYRFAPPPAFYADGSVNKDNAGFCVPAGHCPGKGILNISACMHGAPILLSPPHFYESDEQYLRAIKGLHPKKEDHQTFLDINPLTGILVRACKRLQINVYVRKLPDFFQTGNIKTMVFPVLHLNESVLVDDHTAGKLRLVLFQSAFVSSIPYIILGFGVILGIVFVVLACKPSQVKAENSEEERAPLIRA